MVKLGYIQKACKNALLTFTVLQKIDKASSIVPNQEKYLVKIEQTSSLMVEDKQQQTCVTG